MRCLSRGGGGREEGGEVRCMSRGEGVEKREVRWGV